MSRTSGLTVRLPLLLGCLFAAPWHVWAHKPSDSYLRVSPKGSVLSLQWDIALKDLEELVGLDIDQNGSITWGELKSRRQEVAAHAFSRLRIQQGERTCPLELADLLVTQHSDGGYAVLMAEAKEIRPDEPLALHYSLLFDVDATHRGLVLMLGEGQASTHVLSPQSPSLDLRQAPQSAHHGLVQYVREGIAHIWLGYDHILFLLSLLLPAVLVRKEGKLQGVENFRPALVSVLQVVSMFTLAHSITLWLAVMEYVSPPSRLVESAIALSIVLSAINNIWPILPVSAREMAFAFGLIHGFGFANVLLDLGLSSVSLAVSLFGFNLGVELGQMAIVLVAAPLAYQFRNTSFYRVGVVYIGSAVIALIAALWAIERTCNVTILGF